MASDVNSLRCLRPYFKLEGPVPRQKEPYVFQSGRMAYHIAIHGIDDGTHGGGGTLNMVRRQSYASKRL